MKQTLLACLVQWVLLLSAAVAGPSPALLAGDRMAPLADADREGLATELHELAMSANFHSGKDGGMELSPAVVHDHYRKCLSDGRFLIVRHSEPQDLKIAGNRDVKTEWSIHELVVGFSESWLPASLFVVTEGSGVLQLAKSRGDLAVRIQKRLAEQLAGGDTKADAGRPAPASGRNGGSLSISPADYRVVSVTGIFGTYGVIREGDVLRFDPNSILNEMPHALQLKAADEHPGSSYLNIPEFRLERVHRSKGQIVGYSFFCRQGVQGALGSLLRFDLLVDWGKMFVVYETNGIVRGVMVLENTARKPGDDN